MGIEGKLIELKKECIKAGIPEEVLNIRNGESLFINCYDKQCITINNEEYCFASVGGSITRHMERFNNAKDMAEYIRNNIILTEEDYNNKYNLEAKKFDKLNYNLAVWGKYVIIDTNNLKIVNTLQNRWNFFLTNNFTKEAVGQDLIKFCKKVDKNDYLDYNDILFINNTILDDYFSTYRGFEELHNYYDTKLEKLKNSDRYKHLNSKYKELAEIFYNLVSKIAGIIDYVEYIDSQFRLANAEIRKYCKYSEIQVSKALMKLYDELDLYHPFDDIKGEYLTINTGRKIKDLLIYGDCVQYKAIGIKSLRMLSEKEIDNEIL